MNTKKFREAIQKKRAELKNTNMQYENTAEKPKAKEPYNHAGIADKKASVFDSLIARFKDNLEHLSNSVQCTTQLINNLHDRGRGSQEAGEQITKKEVNYNASTVAVLEALIERLTVLSAAAQENANALNEIVG